MRLLFPFPPHSAASSKTHPNRPFPGRYELATEGERKDFEALLEAPVLPDQDDAPLLQGTCGFSAWRRGT